MAEKVLIPGMPTFEEILSLRDKLKETEDPEIIQSIKNKAEEYKAYFDANLKNIKATDLFSLSMFGHVISILETAKGKLAA